MQCLEFLEYSERWMEGERDAAASAHLKSCANCSALVADLESISRSGSTLAEADPPERVWVSLRNQLEAEGLIREQQEAAVALPAPRGFAFGLRPALASAMLAVMMLASGFYAMRTGNFFPATMTDAIDPTRDGGEVMAELAALAPLAAASMPEVHEHDPLVKAAYKQNLQIIDNAIAMCEKTVKQQPRNETAVEYLRAAYQQKADLLATISQRGAMGD